MNILISNDDGIHSEGIQLLADSIRCAGHTVFVFAPSENRSAVSNAITMHNPIAVEVVGEKEWACSGTPADCVITAFRSGLIPERIDAVFAGINNGANLGTDIIYSGTCAVARQGTLYKVPSVAFSIDFGNLHEGKEAYYSRMADFAAKNAENLVAFARETESRAFLNVNAFALQEWEGVRIAHCLARRCYCNDGIRISGKNDDGSMRADFVGCPPETHASCESDFALCEAGFISISFVQVEPNCCEVVDGFPFSL